MSDAATRQRAGLPQSQSNSVCEGELQHAFGDPASQCFDEAEFRRICQLFQPIQDFRVVDRVVNIVGCRGRPRIDVYFQINKDLLGSRPLSVRNSDPAL